VAIAQPVEEYSRRAIPFKDAVPAASLYSWVRSSLSLYANLFRLSKQTGSSVGRHPIGGWAGNLGRRRMSALDEWARAIDSAFSIALLLSGNMATAEAAVDDAISVCPENCADEDLMRATVSSAIRRSLGRPWEHADTQSVLPLELQQVVQMAPLLRGCFVLRVLAGFSLIECSSLLNVSVEEVETAIWRSYHELSRQVLYAQPSPTIVAT
jgi:hypothetical protein